MQHSHARAVVAALALASLGACDSPTAPHARDMIEETQKSVFSDAARLDARLGSLLMRALGGPSAGWASQFPTDTIVVERNGQRTRYVATMLERVYVPPPGSGGLPYVRRTLLAWDRASQRGLAIIAEDDVAAVALPKAELFDDSQAARMFGRKGFVAQSEHGGREGSFGLDGRIDFAPGLTTGGCAFTGDELSMGQLDTDRSVLGLPTRCETAQYQVSVNALMRRGDPNEAGILAAFTPNASIRLEGQPVRGVRIVTNCGTKRVGKYVVREMACWSTMAYWRDNTQFAPKLGVDVSRIRSGSGEYDRRAPSSGPLWQALDAGSGFAYQCCEQYLGPVRYVVSRPDGTVLLRGEAPIAAHDSVAKYLGGWDFRVRTGSRTLLFSESQLFDPRGNPYTPVVVDLTLLPCPTGSIANDYTGPGAMYNPPAGECYVPGVGPMRP